MLAGIGEPELIDTRNDQRMSRIFGNRTIRRYPAFREFYGMEEAIEQIVSFFKHNTSTTSSSCNTSREP